MKNITQQINISNNNKFLNIHWIINTICNYKCEYCYAREDEENWNKLSNKKIIELVLDNLRNMTEYFNITILGGEPTLHPHINYILEQLNDIPNLKNIYLITNGSKKVINVEKLQLNVTYHPSQIKYDDFIQTLDKSYNLTILLLFDINYIDELNKITDLDFNFILNIKYKEDKYVQLSEIEKEYLILLNNKINCVGELLFKKYNNESILLNDVDAYLQKLYFFKHWECTMMSYTIPVNSADFYQFCTNKKMKCKMEKIICPKDECICIRDVSNEKTRIIYK
jgi:organic radical activating enzyme